MLQSSAMMESLEGRRFLSATAVASSPSTLVASPAVVVKPAILRASAVEGTYKGSATDSKGHKLDLRLTITSTKATLTIVGYGSGSLPLSASTFKKLRNGSFSYDGKVKALSVNISGKVSHSGARIAGSGTVTGSSTVSGTFLLKK